MLLNNALSEAFHRFFPKKNVTSIDLPNESESSFKKDPLNHLLEDLFIHTGFEINRTFIRHTFGPGRFKTWAGTQKQTDSFCKALQTAPQDLLPSDLLFEDAFCALFPQIGFSLSKPVEKIELEGKAVYSSDKGALLISLDENLSEELLNAMIEQAPDMILCLDH